MKPTRMTFLVVATLMSTTPAHAQPQPVIFDLPVRPVWCVVSQAVAVEDGQGPGGFGAVLFAALYARLEKTAIEERVPSLGIPFADSLQAQPPALASASPAGPTLSASAPAPTPKSRYVLRVCANVPPGLPKPPDNLRVEVRELPAAKVYAALCDAQDDDPCRLALQAKLQSDLKLTQQQVDAVEWQVGQPLNESPTAAALRTALTDYKARPLVPGVPVPQLPQGKLVLWTPVAGGR